METTPRPSATQRPGPSLTRPDFRRESSALRIWTPPPEEALSAAEMEERVIADVEATLRDAARRLREVRCLIDRLGAIPIIGPVE